MEHKKEILIGGVFSGILLVLIPPIFIHIKWLNTVLAITGYASFFIGILIFVAGDNLGKIFRIKSKYDNMTPEEILNSKRLEQEQKMNQTKQEIEMETRKLQLEKKKLEIAKLRQQINAQKESSMPDVLGNLSGFVKGSSSDKKKDEFDIRKLM